MRRGRLVDIQAQQVEVGRIRLGTSTQKTSRAGKPYNEPVKLDRFRLTSRSEQLITEAAELYGGEPQPWTPQSGGAQQWEVIISAPSLQVIVPPNPVSQFYEVWAGGRCQLRCDGARELLEDRPCVCGPDPTRRRCKPTTRLSLMLAAMRGVGIWRLETHGYYAAAELPAVADLLSAAGGNVPARLEMEERTATIPNPKDPTKEDITRFMVPVLHVEATPSALIATFDGRPALEAPPQHEAIAAQPATPPPTDAAPPDLGAAAGEQAKQLAWRIFGEYENRIVAATTPQQMVDLRTRIKEDARLPDQFKATLGVKWTDRRAAISRQVAAEAQPAPPPPAQPAAAPSPPPPNQPEDKQAVWLEVQTWAGYQNLKLSDLKRLYGQFSEGQTIQEATALNLRDFHVWMQARASSGDLR